MKVVSKSLRPLHGQRGKSMGKRNTKGRGTNTFPMEILLQQIVFENILAKKGRSCRFHILVYYQTV